MKTALCLHGYFANAGGVEASVKGHKYITSKIPEDTDVFIHSWDVENASLMMDLYNPVSVDIEHQKDFSEELQVLMSHSLSRQTNQTSINQTL